MEADPQFVQKASGQQPAVDEPKKLFAFSWHNHATGEKGEGQPQEMTESEARAYFRRRVESSFSPLVTLSFREVQR